MTGPNSELFIFYHIHNVICVYQAGFLLLIPGIKEKQNNRHSHKESLSSIGYFYKLIVCVSCLCLNSLYVRSLLPLIPPFLDALFKTLFH